MDLGIQICGGNLYGVFVVKVEDDSPAKGPDGLVTGDKLLEVRSILQVDPMAVRHLCTLMFCILLLPIVCRELHPLPAAIYVCACNTQKI